MDINDVRLIIIDPISAYMSGTDDRNNTEVRALLMPLAKMAERLGFAVILVHHLRKNLGVNALNRVLGSVGFGATARTAWTIHQNPQRPGRRLMLLTKNNYHPGQGGLAFSIVDGAIRWESAPVHLTADQAMAAEEDERRPKKPSDRAVGYLKTLLAPGRMLATEVIDRGAKRGYSEKTLRSALKKAEGESKRDIFGGPSYWRLLPEDPGIPEDDYSDWTGSSGNYGDTDDVGDFEEEQE